MNLKNRLPICVLLAFCAALGVGRIFFAPSEQRTPVRETAVAPAAETPALQVSAPVAAPAAPVQNVHTTSVDTSFKRVPGGLINENARLTHFLPSDYSEGTLHTSPWQFKANVRWLPVSQELRRAGQTVAVLGSSPTGRAQLDGDYVTYANTFPDTDERMYVRPEGGIEHDYILRRAVAGMDDSHSLAYSGYLQLSQGLTLWDDGKQITASHTTKGGIQIKNVHGSTVFYLRRPVAWDAAVTLSNGKLDKDKQATPSHRQCATACEYQIDFEENGSVRMAVLTPGRWLASPDRTFPVTIDPNLGPFGLADGSPPIYTGVVGSDTLIPANSGQLVQIIGSCLGKPDNAYGDILIPFPFTYYGQAFPALTPLHVHIDGFASWEAPTPCGDTDNQAIPTAGYPSNAFFVYWDDLRLSTQPGSGIYFFVDGAAPTRRLVIEWFKMGFNRGSNTDVISFNLVLFECDNKIEYIIGQANETDRGLASVGLEGPGGARGIQYDFNSALGGGGGAQVFDPNNPNANPFFGNPFFGGGFGGAGDGFGGGGFGGGGFGAGGAFGGGGANNGNGLSTVQQQFNPISPGTSLVFSVSALGFLNVTPQSSQGCIPHQVCFQSNVTVPPSSCATGQNTPSEFSFHWVFDAARGFEGFTPNICFTYIIPGSYSVLLEVTDNVGTVSRFIFPVNVCDLPEVVVFATPQGGTVPVTIDLEARAKGQQFVAGAAPTVLFTSTTWIVDLLLPSGEPGRTDPAAQQVLSGTQVQTVLDRPGIYRATAQFAGIDTATGLAVNGIGTIYLFAAPPQDIVEDSFVITESKFSIDWAGKHDGPDPDGLPPSEGSTALEAGFPDNPDNDKMVVKGFISLPMVKLSNLLGLRVRVVLNGVDTIFDSVFDANGLARQIDLPTGRTGELKVDLPSGRFSLKVKRSLYTSLGLGDTTERRPVPAHFNIQIENLFPVSPLATGALITYDYSSQAQNFGPPAVNGSARGKYKFGKFITTGVLSGVPSQFKEHMITSLVTGAFLVTDASFTVEGDNVTAKLKGKIARLGGDDLRPRDTSDVIIGIGGFVEVLNVTGTGGFKSSGKAPSQKLSFKRPSSLGKTGIKSIKWKNRAGDFQITTYTLPNDASQPNSVGLNKTLATQVLPLGLIITPENAQQFNGLSRFELNRKSPTKFVKNATPK